MLTTIGAAPGSVAKRDYAQAWRESPELIEVKEHLAELAAYPKPIADESTKDGKKKYREFAAPFYRQFYFVTERVFEQIYRTPSYIVRFCCFLYSYALVWSHAFELAFLLSYRFHL